MPRKRERFATWLLVGLAAVYSVFPYFFKQTEFGHRDITFNYAPIRTWFAEQLRSGHFPLWDPFIGLGRLADAWTSIPIDLLSIIEIPLHLSYSTVYSLQVILIFFALRYVFVRLNFLPLQTSLLTILFVLAPTTSYFLRYYIKGWAFLLFGILFTFMYLYVTNQRRSHLRWIAASTLLLTVGCKFEYVFTLCLTIVPAYTAFVCLETKGRQRYFTLWTGIVAFVSPLLINYWNFNLIINGARSTLRLASGPIVWPDFVKSLAFSFVDLNTMALVLLLLILFLPKKMAAATWPQVFLILATLGVIFFSLNNPVSGYSLGIFMVLGFYLWRSRPESLEQWTILMAKAALLLFYFARQTPGEADEVRIIQKHEFLIEFALASLCATGLFNRSLTQLHKWSLVIIGVVLFYRGIGLVILNYFAGVLWLPARDNFLIELPLAIFSVYGWSILFSKLNSQWNRRAFGLALTATFLFLISHPFIEKPVRNKIEITPPTFELEWKDHQATDEIEKEILDWRKGFAYEPFGHVRILAFFHSFGRKFNVADALEYQSLASGRYATYSTSSRLGIKREEAAKMGSITGAISDKYLRLLRPMQKVNLIENNPFLKNKLYTFYILSVVPKLDCNHLSLFGIRYLEADSGRYGVQSRNIGSFNGLYSLQPAVGEGLAEDVTNMIKACKFNEVDIGQRLYWQVPNPLPRAFFLPGVTAQDLALLTPDDVVASDQQIIVAGKPIQWSAVDISRYESNRVVLETNVQVPGTIILSDLYHTDWSATVDTRHVDLHPVFFLLRGVNVSPGDKKVQFTISYPNKIKTVIFMLMGFLGLTALFIRTDPP